MKKWILFALALILIIGHHIFYVQLPPADAIELEQNYKYKILLVPLDSRPPCQKMVVDAGKMAGVQVITPPSEIMDYYTKKGDTKAIQKWLLDNIDSADGAIVSIDQLLHGGLLASREINTQEMDIQQVDVYLKQLRKQAKNKPIYVFNVLPRITPPPTLNSKSKDIIKISRLIDQISIFENQQDIKDLAKLKEKVDPQDLTIYLNLFKQNTQLNKVLINLTKDQTINKLIIGQDDGEDFGIPNMEKKSLQAYLKSNDIAVSKAMITKGADEVALSLLADFVQMKTNYTPKIYVEYNDDKAQRTIMPFMAGSVGTTVEEKLKMANAKQVYSPEMSDIILYVFIGNDENIATQEQSALKIKQYINEGKSVALVDLSEHFSARETVFNKLVQKDVPLNALTAYAGWNTASNSIGTSLANAIIYNAVKTKEQTTNDILALEYNRLKINYGRYLEDYYYLKEEIDVINTTLRKYGYENVNDLDMNHNYIWINYLLQKDMQRKAGSLGASSASKIPFAVNTPKRKYNLTIRGLDLDVFYPWPRTFEVYLEPKINLYNLK